VLLTVTTPVYAVLITAIPDPHYSGILSHPISAYLDNRDGTASPGSND
jgi:hypothetical protein